MTDLPASSDRDTHTAANSERHPHEPEIPPTLNSEGRCLVCGLLIERERARLLARNLFPMIDRETWREHGGGTFQGVSEGEYRASQIEEEIKSWPT